ncbi:hypothetical protein HKK72_16745 [Actinomadura sp. HBU206391]|nr:hypothetical protein [Actinomadura sp. HBU206391]
MAIVSGVGATVAGGIETAVCRVYANGTCQSDGAQNRRDAKVGTGAAMHTEDLVPTAEEWGGRGTDPFKAPPPPTEQEVERAKDAADEIRDHMHDDYSLFKPWTWGTTRPPAEVLAEMSPGELNALFDELTEEEIRELLAIPSVARYILRQRADLYLLHRLEDIAPDSIEPDFDDVDEYRGTKDVAVDYGYVKDATLFNQRGVPALTDVTQGSLDDCWWMASLGALADTEEGAELIKEMITQNPNGTYTVRFADGEKVTITPFFPVKKDGSLAYANSGQPPVLWPLVLEKAYAEKGGPREIGNGLKITKEGGYEEISRGFPSEAMKTLTGRPSTTYQAGQISASELRGWLDNGLAVTADTRAAKDIAGYQAYDPRVVAAHSYTVVGTAQDGTVFVRNPWGGPNAVVAFTMEEFNWFFARVATNPVR